MFCNSLSEYDFNYRKLLQTTSNEFYYSVNCPQYETGFKLYGNQCMKFRRKVQSSPQSPHMKMLYGNQFSNKQENGKLSDGR